MPDLVPGNDHDRLERGALVYAELFGVSAEALPDLFAQRVGAAFAIEAMQAAGGASWQDPALTRRDRSVAIVTALVCQGVSGDRLTTHLDRAVAAGVSHEGLTVLMTVIAAYAGQAHASLGAETIEQHLRG